MMVRVTLYTTGPQPLCPQPGASGKWNVGSGKWGVGSEKWEVGIEKWEVRSGKWEVSEKWDMGRSKIEV